MKHHTHLTEPERYQLSSLLKAKLSLSQIGRIMGRHKSTISREIRRNKGQRGYRPLQAQKSYRARKARNSHSITAFGWAYIEYLLKEKHSPEQITGRLRLLGWHNVPSHESIYRYIYHDKKSGGTLHHSLRCQKTYRKRRLTGQDRRGQLRNRMDITARPIEADNRERLGDYEGDTVIGKDHKGVLVTLVDRKTRETKIQALSNRKARAVAQACIDKLRTEKPLTITFDNGKEFAEHETIAEVLKTEIYFAKPYRSWERGTNENTNGLIRQFLPKSKRLDTVSESEIQVIEDNLNNRPRKILGYLTPSAPLSH